MPDDNLSDTSTGTQNVDDLPVWARRAITEANTQAASYRAKAQTAADTARSEAKEEYDKQLRAMAEEKTSITGERDNAVTGLNKLKVAIAADVPGEQAVAFADLLKGNTEEELSAHAAQLKTMFGTPTGRPRATDKSQGMGDTTGSARTPAELFADLFQNNTKK